MTLVHSDQLEVFTSDLGTDEYVIWHGVSLHSVREDYGILKEEDRTGQADWKEDRG